MSVHLFYSMPPLYSMDGQQDSMSSMYTLSSDRGNVVSRVTNCFLGTIIDCCSNDQQPISVFPAEGGSNMMIEEAHYEQSSICGGMIIHYKRLENDPRLQNYTERRASGLFNLEPQPGLSNVILGHLGFGVPNFEQAVTITTEINGWGESREETIDDHRGNVMRSIHPVGTSIANCVIRFPNNQHRHMD